MANLSPPSSNQILQLGRKLLLCNHCCAELFLSNNLELLPWRLYGMDQRNCKLLEGFCYFLGRAGLKLSHLKAPGIRASASSNLSKWTKHAVSWNTANPVLQVYNKDGVGSAVSLRNFCLVGTKWAVSAPSTQCADALNFYPVHLIIISLLLKHCSSDSK